MGRVHCDASWPAGARPHARAGRSETPRVATGPGARRMPVGHARVPAVASLEGPSPPCGLPVLA
jgi:hypothetical protein